MKPTVAALVIALVATVATANSHRRLRGGGDNISEDGEFWSRQLQGSGRRMEEVQNEDSEFWSRQLQGSGRRMEQVQNEDAAFWGRELQGSGRRD